MEGLPRSRASCSALLLLAMYRAWGHFIVAVFTEIQTHAWNVVQSGRDVKCLWRAERVPQQPWQWQLTVLARQLPASLSEKVRGPKTAPFKRRISWGMIALKVLGHRMEQFELALCPAQQLGMKPWVSQSRGRSEPAREIVSVLTRWLSRAKSFWNLLRIWDFLKRPEEPRTGFWQWKIVTNYSELQRFTTFKYFCPDSSRKMPYILTFISSFSYLMDHKQFIVFSKSYVKVKSRTMPWETLLTAPAKDGLMIWMHRISEFAPWLERRDENEPVSLSQEVTALI